MYWYFFVFFFSSRRRHTRLQGDWSSDVCSSDLVGRAAREKSGGQREFGAVRDLECFIKIARPDDAEHWTKNLFARYPCLRTDVGEDRRRNEKAFLRDIGSLESES